MSKFIMTRDINGFNSFIRRPDEPGTKVDTTLSVSVAQSYTVPVHLIKCVAIFGYEVGTTVCVAVNATATLPSTSFAPTNSESNPVGFELRGGDTISFITPNTTARVWISLYAIQ